EAPHEVAKVGRSIEGGPKAAHGEFIGMAMFTQKGARTLTDVFHQLQETKQKGSFHEAESLRGASVTDLLQELIDRGNDVQAIDVYKGWLEIDTFEDYRRAWTLIKEEACLTLPRAPPRRRRSSPRSGPRASTSSAGGPARSSRAAARC